MLSIPRIESQMDHKSIEKQLPMENVKSSKSKVAMTHSYDNSTETRQ